MAPSDYAKIIYAFPFKGHPSKLKAFCQTDIASVLLIIV